MFDRRQFTFGSAALGAAAGLAGMASPALALTPKKRPEWRILPTEPFRGKQDDISFVSPDIGWYGNGLGKLFRTTDGGESWAMVAEKPGSFIRALGFLDQNTGFIGNVGTDYYPNVTDKQPLYRTDDGGVTWQPAMADGLDKVAGICGIDILAVERIFQGEIKTSHIIHAAGRVGGPAMVMASRDSGQTWTVQDIAPLAAMILDIKFLDEQRGFICASSSADPREGRARMLKTTNGGATWEIAWEGTRAAENLWKMSWPTDQVGYATVQSYDPSPDNTRRVVLKTTDGGASWQEMDLVNEAGVQQFGIGFASTLHGWVGTRSGGYFTYDGGVTWEKVEMGAAVNKIRIVRAPGVARLFAIGTNVARMDL